MSLSSQGQVRTNTGSERTGNEKSLEYIDQQHGSGPYYPFAQIPADFKGWANGLNGFYFSSDPIIRHADNAATSSQTASHPQSSLVSSSDGIPRSGESATRSDQQDRELSLPSLTSAGIVANDQYTQSPVEDGGGQGDQEDRGRRDEEGSKVSSENTTVTGLTVHSHYKPDQYIPPTGLC